MAFQIDVFLLMFFLILTLVLLWHQGGSLSSLSTSKRKRCAPRCTGGFSHAPQTIALPVDSPPLPRRVEAQRLGLCAAFREVKSRRGAPKRIDTEGSACPIERLNLTVRHGV